MSEQERRHTEGRAPTDVDDPQHGALDDITAAWQQAKDAFEQSERRYRNLVEHSLGLICTHDLRRSSALDQSRCRPLSRV